MIFDDKMTRSAGPNCRNLCQVNGSGHPCWSLPRVKIRRLKHGPPFFVGQKFPLKIGSFQARLCCLVTFDKGFLPSSLSCCAASKNEAIAIPTIKCSQNLGGFASFTTSSTSVSELIKVVDINLSSFLD